MTKVDNLIERRIRSVQFGLLGGLVMVIAGPEAADLSSSVGMQSSVLGAAVVGALLVERQARSGRLERVGR